MTESPGNPFPCQFAESCDGRLTTCRHEAKVKTPVVPAKMCQMCRLRVLPEGYEEPPKKLRGLGDAVAAGLESVGITKERAKKVANRIGLEDCGCDKTQEWLNKLVPFGESKCPDA